MKVHTSNKTIPAQDPYFLRFVLEMPQGARKKAQKSPAMAFTTFRSKQESHRTPNTAAMFLCRGRWHVQKRELINKSCIRTHLIA